MWLRGNIYTYARAGRNDETVRLPRDVPFAGDAHSRREMPRLLTMSPDLSSSHLAGRGNRRGLGISKRVNIRCTLRCANRKKKNTYISRRVVQTILYWPCIIGVANLQLNNSIEKDTTIPFRVVTRQEEYLKKCIKSDKFEGRTISIHSSTCAAVQFC